MKREYKNRAIGEDSNSFIDIKNKSEEQIRTELWCFPDDYTYWAKENGEGIFYSRDDVFTSPKADATHVIIFLK